MERQIDTQVLRLIGPDNQVCAIFEAFANKKVAIQIGDPDHDGGLSIDADEAGNCSVSIAPNNGFTRITLATREDGAALSFRNAEDKTMLLIGMDQNGCQVVLMDKRGDPKLALSVEEDDQPVVKAVLANGLTKRIV